MGKNKSKYVLYTDFAKAFDKVSHRKLIVKLKASAHWRQTTGVDQKFFSRQEAEGGNGEEGIKMEG